jgi:hypothetical protein
MNEASFGRILRSALLLSMASSGVVVACGGRVEGATTEGTSAPSPTATTTSSSPSLPNPPGTDDPPPPPPPPKEDAGTKDASADAGCVDDAELPPDDGCTSYVHAPCSLSPDAGSIESETCKEICPTEDGGIKQEAFFCSVQGDALARYVACHYCVIGRRPDGLGECAPAHGDDVGVFFASASQLEAASVDAFERLERDLEEHGAPIELRTRARRSARDEVRHTRTTAKLATMFGARPGAWSDAPAVAPRRSRTLEDIAIENATEGCVRETFGALVGMFQAERAEDETIRRAMKTIARDESRHAALSWSILAWADGELDDAARARVKAAMEGALAKLAHGVVAEPSAELRTRAGMPSALEAAGLVAAFQRTMPSLRNPSSTSG